jgi:hypothetical protein
MPEWGNLSFYRLFLTSDIFLLLDSSLPGLEIVACHAFLSPLTGAANGHSTILLQW